MAVNRVRVLIVDDDPLVRAGLVMMLDGAGGIEVVADVADGADVPEALDAHHPDVVLMDIRMPEVDGITATRRLRERPHAPEVIVLTTFDTDELIVRALRAGASGFLLKDTPPPQIVAAVGTVAVGEPILSPAVARRLMDRVTVRADAQEQAQARLARLTGRESEIAMAIARGLGNAEIGAQLHLTVATVKAHVSHVLTKLDLGNRTQVALLVYEAELIGG